jgi:hypothetical protein
MKLREKAAYVFAGVAVLETLHVTGKTVTYKEFGQLIGLVRDEWLFEHRNQVSNILYLIAAMQEKYCDDGRPDFDRIVRASDGEPGAGLDRDARLVVD